MPFEKRFARQSDTQNIMKFFHDYWSENHIMCRDEAFLRWQFSADRRAHVSGEAEENAITAITIWDGDTLAGMQGLVYCDFVIGGQKTPAVWLCNLMSAPAYKDQGVGLMLMMGVHQIDAKVIATAGINPELYPFYQKMRYETRDALPRYARVLDAEKLECLTGQSFSPQDVSQDISIQIESYAAFDEAWDEFFDHVIAAGFCGTSRDAHFMNWRYKNHPRFDYRTMVVREDEKIIGAIVYRTETIKDRAEKVIRMVELLSIDDQAALSLIRAVENIGRDEGAVFVDYYNTDPRQKALFKQAGWLDESNVEIAHIPSLFQPLAPMPRDIALAYRSLHPDQEIDGDVLYMTRSDGDQDRPN